jgi:hypothetical protein
MHGAWQRTPQRGDIVVWLLGAVLAGGFLGTALAVLRPIAAPEPVTRLATATDAGLAATPTARPTVAGASTSVVSSSQSASSTENPTAQGPSATRWGPTPSDPAWIAKPWAAAGLELAELRTATRSNAGRVEITVDRLTFLTGKKASAYYAEHPDLEALDFAVVNQNPRVYTFRLASDTRIFLGSTLGSSPTPKAADVDFLLGGFARAQQQSTPIYVWLRHDGKDGGWATYLAEQYFP